MPKISNPRTVISLIVGVYLACLLGYGLIKFPDAPLAPCGSSTYCGKAGQAHTELEYEQFQKWQTMLTWTWIPGVLVIFLLNRQRIRARRLRQPPRP